MHTVRDFFEMLDQSQWRPRGPLYDNQSSGPTGHPVTVFKLLLERRMTATKVQRSTRDCLGMMIAAFEARDTEAAGTAPIDHFVAALQRHLAIFI